MAEQTFRSPGFFEREVDLTQQVKVVEGVPAGVIGTSDLGPAFVPVTVGSFAGFENKFGSLNSDRFGPYAVDAFLAHRTALTYVRVLGAGANTTTADISATNLNGTVKNAGFRLKSTFDGANHADEITRHPGSVQFIGAIHKLHAEEAVGYPIFTDNDSCAVGTAGDVNLIRATVLMASGARMEVMDHNGVYPTGGQTDSDVAKIQAYDSSEEAGTFKLIVSSSGLGTSFSNDEYDGLKIYTASLDPNSKYYISKILNTNPDLFSQEQHLLYSDYYVESEIAKVKYDAANDTVAIMSGSGFTNETASMVHRDLYGCFNTRYQTARTTSFISQPFGESEYDLFSFETLDDGEVGNKRVKISISNLRRSTNPKDEFGTFTVLVRDFYDSDRNMKVLEQFPLCTLNPNDDNYVANKIGDYKVAYNFDAESESERRLNVSGKRANRSRYVRILMSAQVENGLIPKNALPFGFRGIPVLKTSATLRDDATALNSLANNSNNAPRLGMHPGQGHIDKSAVTILSHSIVPPIPFRFKCTKGKVLQSPTLTGDPGQFELADARFFWGVKFDRMPVTSSAAGPATSPGVFGGVSNANLSANDGGNLNPIIETFAKFNGIAKLDALVTGSSRDAFCNNKFTLARVAINKRRDSNTDSTSLKTVINDEITGSASDHIVEAAYIRNGIVKTPHYTITDQSKERLTFASLASGPSAAKFNRFTDFLKFTNMFYGGFDGVNILDRDQRLLNDKATSSETGGKADGSARGFINLPSISSPGSGKFNNAVNSYRTAAKILTDPFASRVNLIAIPGIRDSFVTNYVSERTQEYGMAMYVMDMPAYDDNDTRIFDDSTSRANVRRSVELFESRTIDNNFVATYFPDIIKEDRQSREAVNMPASVAALGAIAFNDSRAHPWFAPAGFSRGSLRDVMNTEIRLNSEDRNILYEARINPIANFPDGGFVIFGQKTLQQNKSALDRVNVRRMLLEVKRIVIDAANKLVFEQNTPATRAKFVSQITPKLSTIQTQQGIDKFKVIMDSSNNTREDIQNNQLNGNIIVVPTRAVEFISMDFIITNEGVSFE